MPTSETDLGFTLGSSDQPTVHSRTDYNSGVGVNAHTRVNMSFVTSEPLFELVWCPNKGLILKSADYSLNKNSSSLLRDVKQSNMVLSPCDRPINESKLNETLAKFEGHIEAANDDNLARSTDQENQRTTDKSNSPSPFIGNSNLALDKLDSALGNKGKEKENTLFHRETNEKTSKADDDYSGESIESCSSVGLFSQGNKRWGFEQNSIVGTKRIKTQVQESSFMNWIANMLKGLPNRNHDVGPTKIITNNKAHEPANRKKEFHTFFESNTNVHERIILNEEKMVTEKRILSSEEIQKPKVPKGMLDAINKLRLSRMDIIRWKNSHIPISNLNGFFVRLRFGKSQGLGEARYHVASINGMERGNLPTNLKNSISVSIWGINCVIESQYVSNHDFLEDELTAWWGIASKSGKIPAEGDLKSKFGERTKFGF